jgi:hypothetical protein
MKHSILLPLELDGFFIELHGFFMELHGPKFSSELSSGGQ